MLDVICGLNVILLSFTIIEYVHIFVILCQGLVQASVKHFVWAEES